MSEFPKTLTHGMGTRLVLDPTRLLLAFKRPTPRKDVESELRELELVLEDAIATRAKEQHAKPPPRPLPGINHTATRYWVRSRSGANLDEQQREIIARVLRGKLDWIGPVYGAANGRSRDALFCPLPNVLVIKPTAGHGDKRNGKSLANVLGKYGLKELPERSKYLGPYRYFVVSDPQKTHAYELRARLQEEHASVAEVRFENMPILVPSTAVPNDTLFAQQWNMTQIHAPDGWDISTGSATVPICVFDCGCELDHPDIAFSATQFNAGSGLNDGSPACWDFNHGTSCSGIAAGLIDNGAGVAGVAGSCEIIPVAFLNSTDVECAAGINFAADNGARVISMSFGVYAPGEGLFPTGWDFTIIDPAIDHAVNDMGCVLCAATGNEDTSVANRYPSRNPLVIACGASDQDDNRKSATSPDGECWWGSNFAPGVSVVAPGVRITTTDRQGGNGYNVDGSADTIFAPCGTLTYASTGDAQGDYVANFNGTSSATPHVAGLAGLLISQYPSLTNTDVRNIIEKSAEKVGTVAYATAAGFPNGTRNDAMGYGRINVLRALDLADLVIKDWSGDLGTEPSAAPGGNFWDFSDIVVRINDDGVFVPDDPSQSRNVERGQTNYLYVRVTNNGPRDARNVTVDARITPWVGLNFLYPQDWSLVDATHVSPTPITATFAVVPAGGSVIAKFSISSAQVDDLWGWISGMSWHPCALAVVTADNDFAFASAAFVGANLSAQRNNLAQRNLSVINVLAGASAMFPMVAGNRFDEERFIDLVVNRSRLPRKASLLLDLDQSLDVFPKLAQAEREQVAPIVGVGNGCCGGAGDAFTFLDRTRLASCFGGCRGVLTIEPGSRFAFEQHRRAVEVLSVKGGELVLRGGARCIDVRDDITIVQLEKQPGQIVPVSLRTVLPRDVERDDELVITVAQRDARHRIVGGASVMYVVKAPVVAGAPALAPLVERGALPASIAERAGPTRLRGANRAKATRAHAARSRR